MNQSAKGVILVVDDIPTNLEVLLEILAEEGHETLVATEGESAVEQARYAQPDLILMDVMMPGVDGFEACRRLKAQSETADIPIIFLTALTETSEKVKGLQLGAVDYITKPLQHEEVIARVHTHLTMRRLQQSLQQSNHRLREALETINNQIDEIAGLQRALLPPKPPTIPGAQVATYHQSYDRAGGDYFDLVKDPDSDRIGLFLADVAGHGAAAAVVVAMLHTELRQRPLPASPAAFLERLNCHFCSRPLGRSFITALFGWYEPQKRRLIWARAGHPPGLLRDHEGKVTTLHSEPGLPLGVFENTVFHNKEHHFQTGETLLWYTDGISETTNPNNSFMGDKGVATMLAGCSGTAADMRDQLVRELRAFEAGTRQEDDQAMLLLHVGHSA